LQRASLRNPVKIEVSTKYSTVDTLVQNYVLVPEQYKDCYLAYLLNEFSGNSIIIFAIQCTAAQRVALMLRNLGFEAIPLHGKLSQTKRLGSLNKFKSGQRKILVATDVASRGLDIPEVDMVINYEIPKHPKDYIHRVGRTARAGNSGRAINLVTQYDIEDYQRIEEHVGQKFDLYPADESTVLVFMERVSDAQRLAVSVREGTRSLSFATSSPLGMAECAVTNCTLSQEMRQENFAANASKKRKGGPHNAKHAPKRPKTK